MSIMDRFRKRNEKFASDFDKGDKTLPPAQRFARAHLHGRPAPPGDVPRPGDRRRARDPKRRRAASDDALRSLIISNRLLGTQQYAVIHRSDCGMLTFSNDDLRGKACRRYRQGRLAYGLPTVLRRRGERP
jgi:carbonic anhydrase